MSTVYVTDDLVGVMWDDRGAITTLGRDGEVGERFVPPAYAVELPVTEDALDEAESGWIEGAVARLRACPAARRLSGKTLEALVSALEDTEP